MRDIWLGMPGWSNRPRDPVIAVARTHYRKSHRLTLNDVCGWPLADVSAVCLLQLPMTHDGWRDVDRPITLDIGVGGREPSVSVPVEYDRCFRFTDLTSDRGIGW